MSKKSSLYHVIPNQISLFSAMITYIKPISFLFRIIRPIRISFFHKIWLIIFFPMGRQAIFSRFEETSRLTVVTSGESTYISSRLRVVTSGIRVKLSNNTTITSKFGENSAITYANQPSILTNNISPISSLI